MATSLEDYIREYLDDPTTINVVQTQQQVDHESADPNESYYRKWLDDPNA